MKSQSDRIAYSFQSNLLRYLRSSARKMSIGVQLAGTIGLLGSLGGAIVPVAQAQVPITALDALYFQGSVTTVKTTDASPSSGGYTANTPRTLNFGSTTLNDRKIDTFSTGSGSTAKTYNFGGLVGNIYIRRNYDDSVGITNGASQPLVKILDRQLGFFETSSLTDIVSSESLNMESILLSQTINRGTDNLFVNRDNGAGNNNNIERVDFVISSGLKAPAVGQINDLGFLVLERKGSTNDTVKVAAITSIDASGKPTGYGPVKTSSTWGASGSNVKYSVMRKDPTDQNWRPSDSNTQSITGIYFSLGDLGVAPGTTIYGYSIIPADVAATSGTNLLDWNKYPMATKESDSGIDLMAGGGVFVTHTISGTVFSDPNGTQVQDGSEAGLSLTDLKAVLLDSAGKVLKSQAVAADGTYKFLGVATPPSGSPYSVILTTATVGSSGSLAPAIVLPPGYVSTGENKGGTVDNAIDTKITVSATDFTPLAGQPSSGQPILTEAVKMNFGLERLPTAVTTAQTAQPNPGGTTSVSVPPTLFNTSTDPDGTVDQYRITSFPTNATSIEIDGIVYTAAGGNGTTAFPTATGVTVLATKLNTIKVDPIDGAVNVTIPFKAIDNAGKESANVADAIVPFSAGNKPELILLKRITKTNNTTVGKSLNGTPIDLTQVVAQPDNPATPRNESSDASNSGWPTVSYPQGAIDAGAIKSGDSIEYTIYFLSAGTDPVRNANICDWVPQNTTFVPNAYGPGTGIQLAIGSTVSTLSNVPDSDRGDFFNIGAVVPGVYPNGTTTKLNCATPAGNDGAVVVNLVKNALPAPDNELPNATAAGTPGNSYGFIRFVSKVK